jgi:hypothetical protein
LSRKQANEPQAAVAGVARREVRVTAKQVGKRNQMIELLLVVLLLLLLIMSISFACVSFVNKAGRFTVNMDPDSFYDKGISICETPDFKNPSIMLENAAVENMTNITKEWLTNDPKTSGNYISTDRTYKSLQDLDNFNGSHNGTNNIAYTFYIKNGGKETVDYYMSIDIESVTKGVDDAIRVMLFKNGKPIVYGKRPRDLNNQYAMFAIDELFKSEDKVCEDTRKDFKIGNIDKYTVVIWLEGWDPECVNEILGGECKLSMNFKIVEDEAASAVQV